MKKNSYPRIECIDGGNATGIIDTATNMLTEGYAVLERDEYGKPISEAYSMPFRTEYYESGKLVDVYEHTAPYPLLVPIINRPDAKKTFWTFEDFTSLHGYRTEYIQDIAEVRSQC